MNTKRSLLTSCIALFLCFAMLLGTTFAWFTDSVTSSGNKIQSGTLKLDLHVLKEGSTDDWRSIKNESAPLFTYENWEPGYTDVTILKVENKGNLSLKWVAKFYSEEALSKLAEVIDVYVLPGATEYPANRSDLSGWNKVGTLDAFINSISTTTYGYLDGYSSATLGIALKMQDTADNEYQDLTLGEFDIRIVATQADGESDDYDNLYDQDSEYPDPNGFSASASVADSDITYGLLNSDVALGRENSDISALLPAGVKLAEGNKNLKLTVKSADTDSTFVLGDGESAVSLDVHIDGIHADNEQPMIVNLGAVLPTGLENTEIKLFHIENGSPVSMTRVGSVADFDGNNQFTYDKATGNVSINVKSFSVFSAIKTNVDDWDGTADTTWYDETKTAYTLATAEQFAGFRDLVDKGITFEGKTVTLGTDINLELYNGEKNEDNRVSFNPISYGYYSNTNKSFMGTFDGGHHTVYGLYQNGWDLEAKYPGEDYTTSTAGGGLFASVLNATIKNLAVSGANITMECVDMGIVVGYAQGNCTFDNIVVTNSKLANYQRYAGGVVGEVCKGNMEAEYTHIFRNVTVDSSVVVSSLWGDFDNACGGVIGGKWGDAKVLMENVTVAARIDAFSDVTAAYQWYAYRRCGMLIGHTEQNSPKSALNADAPFLTCKNVNVYYGDWVDYTYYQFDKQTDEQGNRLWYSDYPWVRAQAGEHNGILSNVRYGNPVIEGQKINTLELAEANCSEKVTITFNQLYGGGQGVYGKADHAGVTVHNSLDKTIYIENNLGWTNLKLDYWFESAGDRWSTIVDGQDMSPITTGGTVYKVTIPAYAAGFKITGDGDQYKVVSTPEISMSQVVEKSTYPLTAFQLTLAIEGVNNLAVNSGKLLYNTPVYNSTNPRAERYDLLIYDKSYAGNVETNPYGVAIVLDSTGKLIKLYDGANVGYYTTSGKVDSVHFTAENFASVAWSELKSGETLIIFPNEGNGMPNVTRTWALGLRSIIANGEILTITTTDNPDVHVCTNVCSTCLGCRNKECKECTEKCGCLEILVDVNIDGFNNTHVVTANNWLYNTQVNTNSYPYASHYKVVVYDKSYNGTFTTNEFGIAVVLDADNKIVKIYDAANGDRSVVYYDANGSEVIVAAGTGNANGTYATLAWSELKDGEKLVIFPNHKSDNSSRNWAKGICNNWENGTNGSTAIITATFKLPSTIYFQNTQDWTNVGIQYWYEDGTTATGVLGATTLKDGLHDVYRVILPANVVKVAFGSANGSDDKATVTISTPEITSLHNGYIYVVNGQTVNSTLYKEGYKTIYFENNWSWKTPSVYMYYTGVNGTWELNAFPGVAMTNGTSDGVFNIYKLVIPAYVTAIVFNDGTKADTTGHQQSVDLTYAKATDGYVYSMLWDGDDTNNKDNLASAKYVEGYKTVYFLNNWNWPTPQYSYMGVSLDMKYVKQEGTYKTYSFNVPNFVTEFKVLGNSEESAKITSITNGATYCMYYTSNQKQFTECTKIYLDLSASNGTEWRNDSAWFAARIWNNDGDAWMKLTDSNGDKIYEGYIPKGYNNVIFCRMNKSASSTSASSYAWSNVWNQTIDLTFGSNNCYKITNAWNGSGNKATGSWSKK